MLCGDFFSGNDAWVLFSSSGNNARVLFQEMLCGYFCQEMMPGYFFLRKSLIGERDRSLQFLSYTKWKGLVEESQLNQLVLQYFCCQYFAELEPTPKVKKKIYLLLFAFLKLWNIDIENCWGKPMQSSKSLKCIAIVCQNMFHPCAQTQQYGGSFVFGSNLPWIRPHCTTQMSLDKIQI